MSEYFNLLVNNCQVAGYLISWSLELELESGGLGVRGQYAGVSTQ